MKQRIKVSYDVETMHVFLKVFEGDEEIAGTELDFNELPEAGDIRARVSLYGLNKLVTDRTSGEADKVAKMEKIDETFAQLLSGEWAKERTVGAVVVSVEVEALAQLKEISIPAAQKALSEYDKETRKKILASPAVMEAAKDIRDERAGKKAISLDDMI